MKVDSCFIISILIAYCSKNTSNKDEHFVNLRQASPSYQTIGEIPLPREYKRVVEVKNLFGAWLRTINLNQDPRIYLFNGRLKDNQSTHFAVLDMPVGSKDLQQCADAIIRLRVEYFFSHENIDSIHFKATDGTALGLRPITRDFRGETKDNNWSNSLKLSFLTAERFRLTEKQGR